MRARHRRGGGGLPPPVRARGAGPRGEGPPEALALARRRGGEAEPEAEGGSLARAIWAEEPECHAARDGEGEVVERFDLAEGLREAPARDGGALGRGAGGH